MRPHIGIFGRTNTGKSSFMNAITRQLVSIVSEQAGTTTDAVSKIIEFGEAGPVVFIDTAGLDDTSELGQKRIKASLEALKKIDLAIIILSNNLFSDCEEQLISEIKKYDTAFFCVHNKADIISLDENLKKTIASKYQCDVIDFSSLNANKKSVDNIVDLIVKSIPDSVFYTPTLLEGLVKPNDHVLLVTPIDIAAPKGRMILPQVQAIRDALDNDCIVTTLKETELELYFKSGYPKPALVVTDSQAFDKVNSIVPSDVPLTGFSILFARMNGYFYKSIEGVRQISKLNDFDNVLILESCSHHVTCDDIGRVKIPTWIKKFTGKNIFFDVVASFNQIPKSIKEYSLVIQCGACMVTRKQVLNRLKPAIDEGVAVTNYGMAIAYTMGIFERAITPFTKNNNGII